MWLGELISAICLVIFTVVVSSLMITISFYFYYDAKASKAEYQRIQYLLEKREEED